MHLTAAQPPGGDIKPWEETSHGDPEWAAALGLGLVYRADRLMPGLVTQLDVSGNLTESNETYVWGAVTLPLVSPVCWEEQLSLWGKLYPPALAPEAKPLAQGASFSEVPLHAIWFPQGSVSRVTGLSSMSQMSGLPLGTLQPTD